MKLSMKSMVGAGAGALAALAIVLSNNSLRWNMMLFAYLSPLNFSVFRPFWDRYIALELALNDNSIGQHQMKEMNTTDTPYVDWNQFYELTDGLTSPIVMRGFYTDSIPAKKWFTDEWLDEHSEFEILEFGSKSKDKEGKDNLADSQYEVEKTTFKKFVQDLRAGVQRNAYGLDELFLQYPELMEEMDFARFHREFNGEQDGTFCRTASAFISGTGHSFGIHNEVTQNMIIQIKGKKVFHVIDPKYSLFLLPYIKANPFSTGFGIDIAENNLIREYMLPKILTSIELNPGDVLFLPSWWWHHVDSIASKQDPIVFMNNCRFVATAATMKGNAVLELFSALSKKNWIHPQLPRAVQWIPYFRSAQEKARELMHTVPTWDDVQDCWSSKRAGCTNYFNKRGWYVDDKSY